MIASSHYARRIRVLLGLTAVLVALTALSFPGDDIESTRAATSEVRGVFTLAGSVRFEGLPPAPQPIDMSADEYCTAAHGARLSIRDIEVDAEGRLRNAIVYVKQGVPQQKPTPPSSPVVLDQRGCMYEPQVIALRAGQTLLVRNSDATLHNVHVSPRANRGFNIGQPIRGLEAKRVLDKSEVGIKVACDIHGWMAASIAVFDHPWFAVTGADGAFSLDGLPPGNYVIEVWHKTLGSQSRAVTLSAGGQAAVSFTFAAS